MAKTKIFGEGRPARTINLVIALGTASFILIFTPIVGLSTFLANAFGKSIVVILGILAFLMVFYLMMNILQPGAEWNARKWGGAAFLVALIIGLGIFISSGGSRIFPGFGPLNININSETLAIIIVLGLTIAVIYILASSNGKGGPPIEVK